MSQWLKEWNSETDHIQHEVTVRQKSVEQAYRTLLTHKLSHYSAMYRKDWYDSLSLCHRLSELFTMLIQSEHSDCSSCADEMSANSRSKKETTEISQQHKEDSMRLSTSQSSHYIYAMKQSSKTISDCEKDIRRSGILRCSLK